MAKPKLCLFQSFAWQEHRDGWAYVEQIMAGTMCCDDGVAMISSIEEQLYNFGPVEMPWVGIVHQVPRHDLPRYPDLTRLMARDDWKSSMPHCLGLWTLCDYTRRFLVENGVGVPVGVLPYVTPHDVAAFDWPAFEASDTRRLLHVGQYQRDIQTFFDLDVPGWSKTLLKPPKWEKRSEGVEFNDSVDVKERVNNAAYDALLARSIVVLDLKDAAANTTIVECMARATPICVNNVGGVQEYLGRDYPLYHTGDIAKVVQDGMRLKAAHDYLVEKRPDLPTAEDFRERMQSSAIYLSLPVPPSQQGPFRCFELTVLIAVYARLHSLREQLMRFASQEDAPDFELILWNNKRENAGELDRIVSEFRSRLEIRIIDSSANIYCAMRMAVPAFARSETLLICDDDVLPSTGYVRRMYDAHREAGPESVICLRGHVIHDHTLSEDDPENEWATEKHMTFHDEAAPPCHVDFAHADNLVISTALLKKAALYPMTHPEYIYVDDYWLSYVLNAQLGVRIQKLQAPDILEFTPSANDPDVALFHNPEVHEQRVRLYIEHMRNGWPAHHDAEMTSMNASQTRSTVLSGMPTKDGR